MYRKTRTLFVRIWLCEVSIGFIKTIDAVVRNVEVIGEAANNLTRDFRSEQSQVEWRKIIATRNRIIHGYASVDLEIIWNITQGDLPILNTEIEKILENLD